MSKTFKFRSPLSMEERRMIEIRLRGKWTIREIARSLARDHTIVVREIKRNRSPDGRYRAGYAQKQADKKSRITNRRKIDQDEWLERFVIEHLQKGWSPEQIAGRLKNQPPACLQRQTISHETIYQYIYQSPYGQYLYRYLRKKKRPRRQKRTGRQNHLKMTIPERVSIHERPALVNERRRLGDWESDSMQFRQQRAGLSVQYERKILLTRLHRLADRSATETYEALVASLESLPPEFWQSVTFDNGLEAAQHVKLRDDYNLATFFCDPYKSWQKGGVENLNGLLRQYLPRNTKLDTLSDKELHEIQEHLNNRPRKKLNYLTPNELAAKYREKILGGA